MTTSAATLPQPGWRQVSSFSLAGGRWACLVASHEGRVRADEARNKRAEEKRKKEEEKRKAEAEAQARRPRRS